MNCISIFEQNMEKHGKHRESPVLQKDKKVFPECRRCNIVVGKLHFSKNNHHHHHHHHLYHNLGKACGEAWCIFLLCGEKKY